LFLARLRGEEAISFRHDLRWTVPVADISVGYALMFAQSNGLAAQFTPAIQAYWSPLKERDGFRRAIASQDRAGIE